MKHIFIFILLMASLPTYGQRMYNKQSTLQLGCSIMDANTSNVDINLQWGMYQRLGQIVAGVNYSMLKSNFHDTTIPYNQITVDAGYLFRLLSNYRRSVVFSAGITALFGYETINNGNREFAPGILIPQQSQYIYGVTPTATLDVFLMRNLAISFCIKERLNFGSDVVINHTLTGLGLKYLIN